MCYSGDRATSRFWSRYAQNDEEERRQNDTLHDDTLSWRWQPVLQTQCADPATTTVQSGVACLTRVTLTTAADATVSQAEVKAEAEAGAKAVAWVYAAESSVLKSHRMAACRDVCLESPRLLVGHRVRLPSLALSNRLRSRLVRPWRAHPVLAEGETADNTDNWSGVVRGYDPDSSMHIVQVSDPGLEVL